MRRCVGPKLVLTERVRRYAGFELILNKKVPSRAASRTCFASVAVNGPQYQPSKKVKKAKAWLVFDKEINK